MLIKLGPKIKLRKLQKMSTANPEICFFSRRFGCIIVWGPVYVKHRLCSRNKIQVKV